MPDPETSVFESIALPDELIEVRADTQKREIDMRLLPWDTVVETLNGPEMFARGAFAEADPSSIYLYGPNHEAKIGLGQNGQPQLTRVPIGKALAVSEPEDGPHVTFKVARTQAGDETLALAADGIVTGVSAEFQELPGGTEPKQVGGRRVRVHHRVRLRGATTTQIPAYGAQAQVLAIRTRQEEPVPSNEVEIVPTLDARAEADNANGMIAEAIRGMADHYRTQSESFATRIIDRLEALEKQNRQEFILPGTGTVITTAQSDANTRHRTGDWVKTALRIMTGEHVSQDQMRALDDLIVSDNVGVVPDAVVQSELLGIIDPTRPFLQTTRQLALPAAGMSITVPVINTRPTVGVQSSEKAEIASTTTSITSTSFDSVTVAGGGDISIQLLKRSDPSYLDLYLALLAEAYAFECDSLAIATLLDSGTTDGTGYIDPEALAIGESWTNAVSVSRLLRPTHIWMSTQAIQEFIDAKDDGTNRPLYWNLAADITVAGGPGGRISGLIPVYVPAMDGSGADVIIGPSRGFAWAEDGSFVLQVDVPSKAGRDVALVGILWFCPLYPGAFTTYRLAS